MAIISASRRTDIPAFFSAWFMERIRAGFFHRVNPFNTKQVKRISLTPYEVDAIVFWSKNPGPLLPHLDELDDRGCRYYFQFTLNPYDPRFEPHTPPLEERLDTFRKLADRVGTGRVIWRYDPVIISTVTPVSWHLDRLGAIGEALKGSTGRLVFSFLDFYGKVNLRLKRLQKQEQIGLVNITSSEHRDEMGIFVNGLGELCRQLGITPYSCAERDDFMAAGIRHGSCIDGALIRELFAIDRPLPKDRNQRGECLCVESVDMGIYNTCSFRCAYCYANMSEGMVLSNLANHIPGSASIINSYDVPELPDGPKAKRGQPKDEQPGLFD